MQSFDALVLSLPARNSTLRMRAWRALKEAGCGVLRDGLYVLPAGDGDAGQLAGTCPSARDGVVARCRVGRGKATIIADADFLNTAEADSPELDLLLAELARIER